MKKYILSGSLYVTIGTLISLVTSAIFAEGYYSPLNPHSDMGMYYNSHFNQVTTMAIVVAVWFVIGVFFQALSTIFEQEWSLLRMSATHFIVTTVGFTMLSILAGWFPLDLGNLFFFWLVYLLVYAFLYWINYRQMRRDIHQINQSLEK